MKPLILAMLCASVSACASLAEAPPPEPTPAPPPVAEEAPVAKPPVPNPCPPLPTLSPDATRFEGRVHWLTVIALYEQCAASKR